MKKNSGAAVGGWKRLPLGGSKEDLDKWCLTYVYLHCDICSAGSK